MLVCSAISARWTEAARPLSGAGATALISTKSCGYQRAELAIRAASRCGEHRLGDCIARRDVTELTIELATKRRRSRPGRRGL